MLSNLLSRFSDRDRRAITILLSFVAVFLIYNWLWLPLTALHQKSYEDYQQSREQWNILKTQEARLPPGHITTAVDLPAIQAEAQSSGMILQIERTPDRKITGSVKSTSFSIAMEWLARLQKQYGTKLDSFSATRAADPDKIDLNFVLNTPD